MSAFAIYTQNKHLYAFKKTKRLKTQHIIQYCVFNLIIYIRQKTGLTILF